MTYPLSYTIESPAFAAIPDDLKAAVYRGLGRVLSGTEAHPRYAHLSVEDRRAIAEILRATIPEATSHLVAR
jgi:hypothetical protein